MCWHVGENKYQQFAKLWEVEDKGTYAVARLGTSRKDSRDGSYKNSNWSFVKFVGKNAYPSILEVEPKSTIVIKAATISLEEYQKDGERAWPKNPQITVFAWEYPDNDGGGKNKTTDESGPEVESDSSTGSDDLPF